MKMLILAAALGGTLLAGPAMAAQQSPMLAMMLPDPDGDGVTTRAEMDAAFAERFARLDTDKDGTLSAAEIQAAGRGGRMLLRADANGDGKVTLAEMHAQTAQRFARLDTNGDGKIDKAEQDAVRERMMQMRGRQASPAAAPSGE